MVVLLLCCLLLINTFAYTSVFADEFTEEETFVPVFSTPSVSVIKLKPSSINAIAGLVMDAKSGRVLYEKNGYTRRPMASTTKIMTATLAIEKGNLDDIVVVSKKAADTWGSDISLKTGEKLTLRELLYGLMLNSGNDAAVAIAEHIGGSVEEFSKMMNKKAKELGCSNTSFSSPHGLDMPDHYTTAYELALITRYALKNPTFSKIVSTKNMNISGRGLNNTNEMLGVYPGVNGVKTGYTGLAGRCLVTSATRNNLQVISVVLGSPTRNARAQSSKVLLDYTFNNFKPYTLVKAGTLLGQMAVIRGIKGTVPIAAVESITVPLSEEEANTIQTQVTYPDNMPAPVNADIEVGSIKFLINGTLIAESSLKTTEDVRRKTMMDYLYDIIKSWGGIMRNQTA